VSLGETLNKIARRLAPVSDTARLDAQVLLAHLLEKSRAWLLAHPEAELIPGQERVLEELAARLEAGEPLPYLLGHWEFFGLDFTVTPSVLIPRPETELLVEQAQAWLRSHPLRRSAADVGTGSGCIAISLAVNLPGLRVVASDLSWQALQVARHNARRHDVTGQVEFVQSDLIPAAGNVFDLICANLPYIPSQTLASLKVQRWEPRQALDSGPQGVDWIQRLLQDAPRRLAPGGLLLLEIEATQGALVHSMARQAFPQAQVRVLPDLASRDRLVVVQS
jgi:release factor glutamine methyltransferase